MCENFLYQLIKFKHNYDVSQSLSAQECLGEHKYMIRGRNMDQSWGTRGLNYEKNLSLIDRVENIR